MHDLQNENGHIGSLQETSVLELESPAQMQQHLSFVPGLGSSGMSCDAMASLSLLITPAKCSLQ